MSEEEHPHFNLVDKPWILARDMSGSPRELSLMELFEQASKLESLANETPQQDFAILRVLLAILQRAISPGIDEYVEEGLYPSDVWGRMWKARELPLEQIRAYLGEWRHRFDLFDDEAPFMQVAGLEAASGKTADARKLLSLSENKSALTQMRVGERQIHLAFDEAARWLVTAQGFDTGGAKTGAAGDPGLKRGKGYPGGPSWDGRLGCIYAEGGDFAETLLLNLVLCDDGSAFDEWYSDDDLPCWEQTLEPAQMRERSPLGRCDLFTWQSRRACLIVRDGIVGGTVFTTGDLIETANQNGVEWFSAWRRSKAAEKRLGIEPVYLPVKHRTGRAMWRGLDSILPAVSVNAGDGQLVPGIVNWLTFLSGPNGGRQIGLGDMLRLRAVGFEYGTQDAIVSDSFDDELEMHVFLLSMDGRAADESVRRVLAVTDDAVSELGRFAAALVRASGFTPAEGSGFKQDAAHLAKDAAVSDMYFSLDGKFRVWLASLNTESDLAEMERGWGLEAKHSIEEAARELSRQASPSAVVGHSRSRGGWDSVATAQVNLERRLNEILGPLLIEDLREDEEAE